MISIDRECDTVARLFSKKGVRAQNPVYVKSENPLFKRKGTSFDLKNLREYQPFDDLRQIDWKLFGRTDRYYIKEFFEEENERLYLLVDTSASLKIFNRDYYLKFIASLAYIFLKLHFTINVISFNTTLEQTCLNIKETKNIHRVLGFLDKLHFNRETDIALVQRLLWNRYRPGTVFLFSDLFDRRFSPDRLPFRRAFLVHFFTSLLELNLEFGETEIEDQELNKRMLLPYNSFSRKRFFKQEDEFLARLKASRRGTHYFHLSGSSERVPCYWRILEALYD